MHSPARRPSRTNGHSTGLVPSTPRELLKDRAYDELKLRILRDDYPPGSFLAERFLAEQLGMSKTPVKAALDRLAMEGFVAVSPQQGIVVRELAVAEIADQYEIRVAIESYTLKTIAGRLSAEQQERIRENLAAQQAILGQANIERGVALDAEFHTLLAASLGNQEIVRVMKQLRDRMQRVITRVFQLNPGRIDTSYEEHLAIAESVFHGAGAEAARLIEVHLERGRQMILAPRRA